MNKCTQKSEFADWLKTVTVCCFVFTATSHWNKCCKDTLDVSPNITKTLCDIAVFSTDCIIFASSKDVAIFAF